MGQYRWEEKKMNIDMLCEEYGVTQDVIYGLIGEGFNEEEIVEILIEAEW